MGTTSPTETGVQVQLTGVHLCCDGCTDAVDSAVASVPGATSRCDKEKGTVILTAGDRAAAQRALDAIASAGLHGETGDAHLTMKDQPDLPPGKVRRVIVSDIHNCCLPCYQAIKGAISTVAGVTADTAAPRKTTFEVTGDFSAAELSRALNAAGFHARLQA